MIAVVDQNTQKTEGTYAHCCVAGDEERINQRIVTWPGTRRSQKCQQQNGETRATCNSSRTVESAAAVSVRIGNTHTHKHRHTQTDRQTDTAAAAAVTAVAARSTRAHAWTGAGAGDGGALAGGGGGSGDGCRRSKMINRQYPRRASRPRRQQCGKERQRMPHSKTAEVSQMWSAE